MNSELNIDLSQIIGEMGGQLRFKCREDRDKFFVLLESILYGAFGPPRPPSIRNGIREVDLSVKQILNDSARHEAKSLCIQAIQREVYLGHAELIEP